MKRGSDVPYPLAAAVRAFLASLSMSLLALTLSYQTTAIPAALTPPMPNPKSDAWMDHASTVKVTKGRTRTNMSKLAPSAHRFVGFAFPAITGPLG